MINLKAKSEKEFIWRVVIVSLVLLLIFSMAGLAVYRNSDAVKGFSVNALAAFGSLDAAKDLAESIEDEALRLESCYRVADKMYSGAEFEAAAELFESLGEYTDSAERSLAALYAYADWLYSEGEYQPAMEAFAATAAYSDSAERQKACVYALAEEALEDGDCLQAVSLFSGLADYSDSKDRAYEAALALSGDAETARIIVSSGGLSAEALEKAAEITALRSSLPIKRLAAGSYHTVFLRDDGTVAACGDNSDGRCDVSGWSDIIEVGAGAKHSVGLRADGSLVAVGDNSYGQCDVQQWKNVVKIAVGDYDTVALLADGSILSCGYHDFSRLGSSRLENLFAGSYAAAAVNDLGYLVSSHKSVTAENARLLLDFEIGTGCTAALYADGRLVSAVLPEGELADIVQAELSPRALLALDTEGRLYSRFFRESDAVSLPAGSPILACAAGSEHYVFINADGSLSAYGDNSRSQCDVGSLIP